MRKVWFGVIAGAAVVGGGVTGAMAWSVGAAVAAVEARPHTLTAVFPKARIVEQHTQRTPFSATHDVTVELGCLPSAPGSTARPPLRLQWRDRIDHGTFGDGVLARVESTLVVPDALKPQLLRVFGSDVPFTLHTTARTGGVFVTELRLAQAKFEDAAIGGFESGPITLSVRTLPGTRAGSTRYEVDHPAMEVRSFTPHSDLRMHLGKGHMDIERDASADGALVAPQRSKATLDAFSFDGELAAPGSAPSKFHGELSAVTSTSEASLSNGLLTTQSRVDAKGKIQGVSLDALSMRSELSRIAIGPYQRLLTGLVERVFSCDSAMALDPETLLGELTAQLGDVLPHDPALSFETSATFAGGRSAKLGYSLGTKGVSEAEARALMPLWALTKGFFKANASVDRSLVESALRSVMTDPALAQPGQPPPDPAELLRMVETSGFVQRAGEELTASLAFEAGQVLVNGAPLPPEVLAGILGGVTAPAGP
jgi:hypothetical protein